MRHSKSLKLLNRATAALSSINLVKKTEKPKHLGGKNRKKVKRNSTGNMEIHLQERSMQKNKQKGQKKKEYMFKDEIGCQPIPQSEKPTLVDKVADYRPNNFREINESINQHEACYYTNPLESQKSSMKKISQDSSIVLERKNQEAAKRKQTMNIFTSNRLIRQTTTESLIENLDSYILALKKTQSVQTLEDIHPNGRKKPLFQGLYQKAKQKQMYWILNQEINKAETILEQLIIENYYQAKRIQKNNKRHHQIKKYISQVHQRLNELKNGIYYQKMQRKNCQKKLTQYAQMFMTQKRKSRYKLINIYHDFEQQPDYNEEQSEQVHIYPPIKFSHKKGQKKVNVNDLKQHISGNRMKQRAQRLLKCNYDSDSDINNQ